MPAYSKYTVAELRQMCETRGIEHDGLTKTRLIAALRKEDVHDYDEEDAESVEGVDGEIQLGGHLFGAGGSVPSTPVDAGQDLASEEGETESVKALRLKLALKEAELKLKEMEWQIERERMSMQAGSQSSRGTNVQLPSEIFKMLPRMSSNDRDVLTFFRTCERAFKTTGVDRSRWHEFMPAYLSKVAMRRYMMMSIDECRNYDLVKETLLRYFDQDTPEYPAPYPGGEERERAERSAQQEKRKHERQALRLKQKREREERELKRRAREQEIRCNNQCKTLFAMYEAMDHPEVNSYADDVHCNASRFVDDVFDVMLCDNARVMSVINDEIVTECANEQACVLLQNDIANCYYDKIVGLGAPVMAVEAATAAAPLQTKIIDFDSKDCTPMHETMLVDSVLQTGDSVKPTGRPVIGDNDDRAFFDDRQAPPQQFAELLNFAASDSEGGIGSGTDRSTSGVTTISDGDAAEQRIREFNQVIVRDADGNLGFQILAGDMSRAAQCSDEFDAEQMASVSRPQCETDGRIGGTVRLTEEPKSESVNYDVNSSDISHSAAAIAELVVNLEDHAATAAKRVAAESVGPPVAINANNSTMAADVEHAAGQGNPEVQVLITRRARQEACNGAQISCDSERTGSTSAAEPASDSDTNLVDNSNPANISARETDMDSRDNVPRSDKLQGVSDIKLSDLMPGDEQTTHDGDQGHGGLQKGVTNTRDETAAKGPGQVTVEPCGKGGPQTVVINGDNSKTEWSDWTKATKPCSKLRAKVPRYAMKIFEMMSRYMTDAKCKSQATVKYKMDQYIYGRIT